MPDGSAEASSKLSRSHTTLNPHDVIPTQGDFSDLMTSLSSAIGLQHVELKGNTGIQGSLDADDATALCNMIQNGLQYLDLGSMELAGTIPG